MFRISKNKGTNLFPNHLGDIPNTKKNNNQEKILIFFNHDEGSISGGSAWTVV
jgi:hypothetical protein